MPDKIVILVVDDEVLIADVIKDALEDAGFEVLSADDGTGAMALLDGGRSVTALVTDINMGEGPDGWAVARHARGINGALPVVYMTGAAGADWPVQGVPHSVMVGKPFVTAQIVTALATLLNTESV